MSSIYTLTNVVPSTFDSRDYVYSPIATTLPRVDLRQYAGNIEHQGSVGSCTANSVVSACEIHLQRQNKFVDLSRLFVYYISREMEGRNGQEGAYLRDALKVCNNVGVCPEDYWKYDISKVNVKPSAEAYALAEKLRITEYSAITGIDTKTKIDGVRSALSEGLPVVIAMPVSTQFTNLHGNMDTHNYTGVAHTPVYGNHAMTIVGYDDEKKYFIVENSWGAAWGDNGYFALPYSVVGDVYEFWAVRGFSTNYIETTKHKIMKFIEKYRVMLIGAAVAAVIFATQTTMIKFL